MLTIENINILNSKFAGTPEWQIGEMFIGEQNYIFQIHKRVGEWIIGGVKHSELTIRLHRVRTMYGYVMETGLVKQNYHNRSAYSRVVMDRAGDWADIIKELINDIC